VGTTLLPKHSSKQKQTLPGPAETMTRKQKTEILFVQDRASPRLESHETRSSQKTFDHVCPASMILIAVLSFKSDL